MIALLPLVEFIKNECPILEDRVKNNTRIFALTDQEIDEELPQASVLPVAGLGGQNKLMKGVSQVCKTKFSVVFAAVTSDGVSEPIVQVFNQIDSAVLKYGGGSITYESDGLFEYTERVTYWMIVYEYSFVKTKV